MGKGSGGIIRLKAGSVQPGTLPNTMKKAKEEKETSEPITAKALAKQSQIKLRTVQIRAKLLKIEPRADLGGLLLITPEQAEAIINWPDRRTARRKPESELKPDSRHKRTYRDKRKAECS
jgi:hypothetical protein